MHGVKKRLNPVYQVNWETYKNGQIVPVVNNAANGYRLLIEKEWEWAARGGLSSKGYTYSGSNDVETVAWTEENSKRETKIVGSKLPNELGIYDMSGNVYEWCWDKINANRRLRGEGGISMSSEALLLTAVDSTPMVVTAPSASESQKRRQVIFETPNQ